MDPRPSPAAWLEEPARRVPLIDDVDVCVLGGGATGVFAAVRAARMGARVALVERLGMFGGMATAGLVNVWHSPYDATGRERVIGGLTKEVTDRLAARGAAVAHEPANPARGHTFNPGEMAMELDRLVTAHPNIRPRLHTRFCAAATGDGGAVSAVYVEDKDGRGAIRARAFVDATGDGDLAARIGWPFAVDAPLQPPTACALLAGFDGDGFRALYNAHRAEYGLPEDSGWHGPVPGLPGVSLFAETHAFGTDASDAAALTRAEIEGRRVLGACLDLIRDHGPTPGRAPGVAALCAHLGVRETRRFAADHRLTGEELLRGADFPDTVARGTYRVDVHNASGGGFVFRYLDGREERFGPDGFRAGRWRPEGGHDPRWYNIPYRVMTRRGFPNVWIAGRMVSTDRDAFGAVRVMVNLNQLGEAAGTAAALAPRDGGAASAMDATALRAALRDGGSLLPD